MNILQTFKPLAKISLEYKRKDGISSYTFVVREKREKNSTRKSPNSPPTIVQTIPRNKKKAREEQSSRPKPCGDGREGFSCGRGGVTPVSRACGGSWRGPREREESPEGPESNGEHGPGWLRRLSARNCLLLPAAPTVLLLANLPAEDTPRTFSLPLSLSLSSPLLSSHPGPASPSRFFEPPRFPRFFPSSSSSSSLPSSPSLAPKLFLSAFFPLFRSPWLRFVAAGLPSPPPPPLWPLPLSEAGWGGLRRGWNIGWMLGTFGNGGRGGWLKRRWKMKRSKSAFVVWRLRLIGFLLIRSVGWYIHENEYQ